MAISGEIPLPAPTSTRGPPSASSQVRYPSGPSTASTAPTGTRRTSTGEILPPGTSLMVRSMVSGSGHGEDAAE